MKRQKMQGLVSQDQIDAENEKTLAELEAAEGDAPGGIGGESPLPQLGPSIEDLKAFVLDQHKASTFDGASRIDSAHFLPRVNPTDATPQMPSDKPFFGDMRDVSSPLTEAVLDLQRIQGKNAVKYFEDKYPQLKDHVLFPIAKLADPSVWADAPIEFNSAWDVLNFTGYLTEKGIMAHVNVNARAANRIFNRPLPADDKDAKEWEKFRYTASPVMRGGAEWLHSLWASNKGGDIVAFLINPASPAGLKVIDNATTMWTAEEKKGFPWATANRAHVSAMYSVAGLDIANLLNIPAKAIKMSRDAAKVAKLGSVLDDALKIARAQLEMPLAQKAVENAAETARVARESGRFIEVIHESKAALIGLGQEGKTAAKRFAKELEDGLKSVVDPAPYMKPKAVKALDAQIAALEAAEKAAVAPVAAAAPVVDDIAVATKRVKLAEENSARILKELEDTKLPIGARQAKTAELDAWQNAGEEAEKLLAKATAGTRAEKAKLVAGMEAAEKKLRYAKDAAEPAAIKSAQAEYDAARKAYEVGPVAPQPAAAPKHHGLRESDIQTQSFAIRKKLETASPADAKVLNNLLADLAEKWKTALPDTVETGAAVVSKAEPGSLAALKEQRAQVLTLKQHRAATKQAEAAREQIKVSIAAKQEQHALDLADQTETLNGRISYHEKKLKEVKPAVPNQVPAGADTRVQDAEHAVAAHLMEKTSGGRGLANGTVAKQVVSWVRGGLGEGWASVSHNAPGAIEDAASALYHHFGFRPGSAPASEWAPFAHVWRKLSESNYPGMEEVSGNLMDWMRSHAAGKMQVKTALDLEGRVGKIATATYTGQKVVDDVLKVLRNVDRSVHDISGSFRRSWAVKSGENSILAGVPQATVDLAHDIAVQLGHGHNGIEPFVKNYSMRASEVTKRVAQEAGQSVDEAAKEAAEVIRGVPTKRAKGYEKQGKGAFAETAPIKIFADWVADATVRVTRDSHADSFLKELNEIRTTTLGVFNHAKDNGLTVAQREASGMLRVIDQMATDLNMFRVNPVLPGTAEPGAVMKVINKFNGWQRVAQLFLQPVTGTMNALNSTIEKNFMAVGKADFQGMWSWLRGGAMRAPSLDAMGQPIHAFSDPALYSGIGKGSANISEAPVSWMEFLSPTARFSRGENTARGFAAEHAYWNKFRELTEAFPDMTKEAKHTQALAHKSEIVGKFHFNADDLPPILGVMRKFVGYPDFNVRDLGVILDYAMQHPAQALFVGRTLDMYNNMTHGQGFSLGTVPGTNAEIRFDPAKLSGAIRGYERVFEWKPMSDEDKALDGTAYAGAVMVHLGRQGFQKIVGGFLPGVSMVVHSSGVLGKGTSAPTVNPAESLVSTISKHITGYDFQVSDMVEWAMGKNPGEDRKKFAGRGIYAHMDAAALESSPRLLSPEEATKEYYQDEAATKTLAWFAPGFKVQSPGKFEFVDRLSKANAIMLGASEDSIAQDSMKAQIRENPYFERVASHMPYTATEARYAANAGSFEAAAKSLGLQMPEGEGPENRGIVPGISSATHSHPYAAALSGEPTQLVPLPNINAAIPAINPDYTRVAPDDWAWDRKQNMMMPKLERAGFTFGIRPPTDPRRMSDRDLENVAKTANRHIQLAASTYKTPEAQWAYINTIKNDKGVPWVARYIEDMAEAVAARGISPDIAMGANTVAIITSRNIATSGGNYPGVEVSGLSASVTRGIPFLTGYIKNEIRSHGAYGDAMREVVSSPEKFMEYLDGKNPTVKPTTRPSSFDAASTVSGYTLSVVRDTIQDSYWASAADQARRDNDTKFPGDRYYRDQLKSAAYYNPELVSDIVDQSREGQKNGTVSPGFYHDFKSSDRALFERVAVTAHYPEIKSSLERVLRYDQNTMRPVGLDIPSLRHEMANGRMEAYSAIKGGWVGKDMQGILARAEATEPFPDTETGAMLPFNFNEVKFNPEMVGRVYGSSFENRVGVSTDDFHDTFSQDGFFDRASYDPVAMGLGTGAPAPISSKAPPATPAPTLATQPAGIADLSYKTQAPRSEPAYSHAFGMGQIVDTSRISPQLPMRTTPHQGLNGYWRSSIEEHSIRMARYNASGGEGPRPSLTQSFASNILYTPQQRGPDGRMISGEQRLAVPVRDAASAIQGAGQIAAAFGAFEPESDASRSFQGLGMAVGAYSTGALAVTAIYGQAAAAGMMGGPVGIGIAVVAVGLGVAFGLIGKKKGGGESDQQRREREAENARRAAIEAQRVKNEAASSALRDLTGRAAAVSGAVRSGPAAYDKRAVAKQLAAYQRRPSFQSKVGLVDALEREMASAMKPKW